MFVFIQFSDVDSALKWIDIHINKDPIQSKHTKQIHVISLRMHRERKGKRKKTAEKWQARNATGTKLRRKRE